MVMAAGLGTRLRPITWEIPKPVVPVCNRPIVAHLVQLLSSHGFDEVIANLHWFPETVKACVGDGSQHRAELSYRYEEELLGTAGGVRGVSDFLTGGEDDVFVVLAGDALTDVDLGGLLAAHRTNGGLATLAVKQVADVSQYGVIVTDGDGRVQGFQEKPDPAEALSDLVNCMIYAFSAEIFDYFPDGDPLDFATDVFPALLSHDVPFHVHRIDRYWNDIGTLPEYVTGNLDALRGRVAVDPVGEVIEGETTLEGGAEVTGPVLVGRDVEIGAGANLVGPLVLGAGSRIGAGARLREGVLLPGAEVAAKGVFAQGIAGGAERLASADW
jgi:mannose-1-phosphate guanylyltransferase/mannose-1-phosphate guanylyltransferase/phosphomannomutase